MKWEGIKIRVDNVLQSESMWEGTEFAVCPKCKQIVRKEEIDSKIHVCFNPGEIISEVIMS